MCSTDNHVNSPGLYGGQARGKTPRSVRATKLLGVLPFELIRRHLSDVLGCLEAELASDHI